MSATASPPPQRRRTPASSCEVRAAGATGTGPAIASGFRGPRRFHNYETEYASGHSFVSFQTPGTPLSGMPRTPVRCGYSSFAAWGKSRTETSRPFSRSACGRGLLVQRSHARRCCTMSMAAYTALRSDWGSALPCPAMS